MSSVKSIGWFIAGFVAATVVMAAASAGPAFAQTSFEPLVQPSDRLLTRPRGQQSPAAGENISIRSTLMPEPLFDAPGGRDEASGAPSARGVTREPVAQIRSSDGAVAPARRAAPSEDGSFPAPDVAARYDDGVFTEPEPEVVRDGEDPTRNDTRQARDADAFETPQQVADTTLARLAVEPLHDRLVDRLFRFEPYERVGYPIGGFILFPELELGGMWRSNVTRTPLGSGDTALIATPSVEAISNWNSHALALRGSGNFSEYGSLDTENDRTYQLEARGRVDVTRRTSIEGLASRGQSQEQRSSIDVALRGGARSDVVTDRVIGAYNTRFNRLSLQLRGGMEDVRYADARDPMGGAISNRDRDSTRQLVAARASWAFKPMLSAFAEAGGDRRTFDEAALSDGIKRDSSGRYIKTGVGFGNTGGVLRGEFAVGYRLQDADDRRLQDVEGALLDADVAWRINALSALRFRALSEVVETTLANSAGSLARRVEVDYRHELRRHLIATAGLGYAWQTFAGQGLSDRSWTGQLGIEYYVNREIALFGRYQHTDFWSGDGTRDYVDDTVIVGARIRR